MAANILANRRKIAPAGLAGGEDGAPGRNWVERSLILGRINVTALYPAPAASGPEPAEVHAPGAAGGPTDLQTLERRHILGVLASVQGDKGRAAQLLGISRRTLERRVAEWAAEAQ